jgi:hypothetical protein
MDNLFWIRDSDNDTWNDFVETKMDPVRSQAYHPVMNSLTDFLLLLILAYGQM